MVISWLFSTSLHSNVKHIRKQIWRNYAKIYQRFLIHTRSIPRILVNLSVVEKGIHDAETVATTELQKYLPFSFSPVTPDFPITPFHVSVSVPTCALISPIRTANSVGDTRRRAWFKSSTKAWYSLVALGAYTCNRHNDRFNTLSFNIQTRDPKEIQSSGAK